VSNPASKDAGFFVARSNCAAPKNDTAPRRARFRGHRGRVAAGRSEHALTPYPPREPKKGDVLKLLLEPRSIYLLRGSARWGWQHSVSATRSLRYSLTFRTARRR
jgi:hypothetical protein